MYEDMFMVIDQIEMSEDQAYANVVSAVTECFHKEMEMLLNGYSDYTDTIFTEAKSVKTDKHNILTKMLNVICKFFRWIGNGISRLIQSIKNFFKKTKATSTPDQIMDELNSKTVTEAAVDVPSSEHSDYKMDMKVNTIFKLVSCTIKSGEVYIKPNDVKKYGNAKNNLAVFKMYKDLYGFDNFDTLIKIYDKKIQKMENKMDVPGMSCAPGVSSVLHIFSMMEDPSMLDILDEILDEIKKYCTDPSGFDEGVAKHIKQLWIKYSAKALIPKIYSTEYKLSDFQKLEIHINRLIKKHGQLQSPTNTSINIPENTSALSTDIKDHIKDISNWLKVISTHLENLPMGMNLITNSIKHMWIISDSYSNTINNPSTLAEFVERCIKAQIPPKYIAYNAWKVTTPELNGYGTEFKPAWGQSRCVFFPKDKPNLVYKFALQYWGMRANKNEVDITKICKNEGCDDIIAKVVNIYKDHAMIACERVTPYEDAHANDPDNSKFCYNGGSPYWKCWI